MLNYHMPETLRGDWIWRRSLFDERSVSLFARKEFTLDYGGLQGDLWISADSSYNLFVNDRHLSFGPPPGTDEISYAVQYDITYYLETGVNVIALVARHHRGSGADRRGRVPGLWCQIEVDGKPIIWTDESWRLIDGAYCVGSRESIGSPGEMTGELTKLSHYPRGWTFAGFDDSAWSGADSILSIERGEKKLTISPVPMTLGGEIESINFVSGSCAPPCLVSCVRFDDIFQGDVSCYAATTWTRRDKAEKVKMLMNHFEDVALFVNNQPVSSTGVKSMNGLKRHHKQSPAAVFPLEGGRQITAFEINFDKGWNQVMIAVNLRDSGVGLFMVFPQLADGDLPLFCEKSDDALPGWKTHGPLKLPFSMISAPLDFERRNTCLFHPMTENVNDLSILLENYLFEKNVSSEDGGLLKTGDYRIYDFSMDQFGLPSLLIKGGNGDVVDVVYGENVQRRLPVSDNDRVSRGDTLVLREGDNQWTKLEPCRTRHLMVLARDSAEGVTVEKVAINEFLREYENETYFQCSESEFNQIWEVGSETLKRSAIYQFADFSAPKVRQRSHDAMIQSMAMAFTFGDFVLTEKVMREFTREQYENGFIPSEIPAGKDGFKVDVSLLWPVWLNYHLSLSGHKDFRDEMLPYLDNFIRCLDGLAKFGDGLLCDLNKTHQMDLFIDYNSTIDARGTSCALNALYCRSLLSSASVYQHAGAEDKAAACREKAAAVAQKIRKLTWDSGKGLFADYNHKGKKSSDHSFETNVLALYSGVAPREWFETIFNQFFLDEPPYLQQATPTPSLYFNFFILETLFAYGLNDWAMKYLKHAWGELIGRGAKTWRPFADTPEGGDERSLGGCFGGGTCPNVHLVRELAGLRPMNADFSTIYFNPALESAEWVKTSIHSPLGRINLEWSLNSKRELEVKAEANYPLNIVPVLPESIAEKTTFHFGSKIAVMELEE